MLFARIVHQFARLRRECSGAAAIEFSLLVPILAVICVTTIDLGFALNQRMAIDSSLRLGAATAMANPNDSDVATVRAALKQVAEGSFTTVTVLDPSLACNRDAVDDGANLKICAQRFCACPSAKTTAVACTATCTGATPLAFFNLAAGKKYNGVIFPQFNYTLAASLKVQVK